jgi:hypothetical protein
MVMMEKIRNEILSHEKIENEIVLLQNQMTIQNENEKLKNEKNEV